jgi:hypothetical protein
MGITKILKGNVALAAGILLPLVIVVLFLLSTWIPKALVDPPQYDFLYTQDRGYYENAAGWRYQVSLDPQRNLVARAFRAEPNTYAPSDRLFLFEHEDGNVREIPLPVPESTDVGEEGVQVEVAEFRGRVIDPSRISPDGYSLVEPYTQSRGILGLFYSSRRNPLAISKNGAVFEGAKGSDVNWYAAEFIGWLIPQEQ